MKKLSIICVFALTFCLMAAHAFAIEFCKDFLEQGNPGGWSESLKTFEEEWVIGTHETIDVDIWINDCSEEMISGGIFIDFDPSVISVVQTQVQVYDGTGGPAGPWDSGMTSIIPDAGGPGTFMIVVANLGCARPDDDGDLIIARIRFRCESEGDASITFATIPGFDTFVGCSSQVVYDNDIFPNTITIQQRGASETTTTTLSNTSTTSTVSSLWQLAYEKMWDGNKEKNISRLRSFRDTIMSANKVGKEYISLLYGVSPEVARMVINNPSLSVEISEVTDQFLPTIESLLEGKKASISAEKISRLELLLSHFEPKASPRLKEIIKKASSDIRNGELFKQFGVAVIQ